MGMFGKKPTYDPTTGIPADDPSIGARVLNQIGANLLGVNVLGIQRHKALQDAQRQFLADYTAKLGPQYATGPAPQVSRPDGFTLSMPDASGDANGLTIPDASGPSGRLPTVNVNPAPAQDYQYQMPQRTADGLSINSPEMAALAQRAAMLGVNIAPSLDVLKAQTPDVGFAPDGTAINKHDGSLAGRRFANPTVVNGRIVDVNDPTNLNASIPQQAPFGWRMNPDGSAAPIQGGPSDPAYIAKTAGVRRDAVISRPMPGKPKAVNPNAIKWD